MDRPEKRKRERKKKRKRKRKKKNRERNRNERLHFFLLEEGEGGRNASNLNQNTLHLRSPTRATKIIKRSG